jgi:hypothetical protein
MKKLEEVPEPYQSLLRAEIEPAPAPAPEPVEEEPISY